MKRTWPLWSLVLVLLGFSTTARADPPGEIESFDLTAVSPPVPAMTYELLVDPIDKQPGNAADYYQQMFQLWTPQLIEETDKANDAAETDGIEPLNSMEIPLQPKTQALFDLLEKASRQDHCDWNSHIREQGFATKLLYLNDMRGAARMAFAQALWQIHQGKTREALATLRLCFEMGQNSTTDTDPAMIATLVGAGIDAMTAHDGLIELMNQPGSPNLYWALSTLPRPLVHPRQLVQEERFSLFASIPLLVKARTGELSSDEWRAVFKGIADISAMNPKSKPMNAQSIIDAAMPLLPEAQDYYAKTRKLPPDEVEKIDQAKVLGVYCFEQYQAQLDDIYKLVELPYPLLISKLPQGNGDVQKTNHDSPGNPFFEFMPAYSRAVESTMRVNRLIAALTAVEAIRSYAAANQARLPTDLSNIVDTPVPDDPRTGQPFDYSVQSDTATLSDPEPNDYPLTYTIRIGK